MFDDGALGDVANLDVTLNVMHDPRRVIDRTGAGMTLGVEGRSVVLESRPPDTVEARDALAMVRAGVYRGLSVEMHVQRDTWAGNRRNVHQARLRDVGLVDRPAYSGSTVEARAEMRRNGARLEGFVPYGVPILISMARNRWMQLEPRSLSASLPGEVYLLAGVSYDNALAGTRQGTLELTETDEGIAFRSAPIVGTIAAQDFLARLEAGMVQAVTPGLAGAETDSVFRVVDGNPVEVVRRGALCELRAVTRDDRTDSGVRTTARRRQRWPLL